MQTIYLDISNKGVVPTVYAKQNDVGRKFAVILTDSGLPYIPVSGSAFSVWYKGASGDGNYTDIGDKSAFSLNGNKVEIEMIVQMLSAHGDGILCLTLNSPNGNQISSWNIPYMCEIVPGSESEKAKEYYTAFSESVEKLKQVTENLTPEAIGAAPAGYGLGTECQYIGSWNDATKSGFYKSNGDAPDAYWWWGHVAPYDANNGVQVVFREENGVLVECHRLISEGIPKEWERENPPMIPGVKYRTTRRHNGKVVYAKLLNTQSVSAGSNTIYYQENVTELLNVEVKINTSVFGDIALPFIYGEIGSGYTAFAAPNKDSVLITCGANISGIAYVTIWFTED